MIFINFKTYEQSTGENAISLAKLISEIAHETHIKLIPVVQAADVREVCETVDLEVWTQHVDPESFGAHTGKILPEAVYEDGAIGTFLNHSEHRFSEVATLEKAHIRAKDVGLRTLIFARDLDELKLVLKLQPDFVSYEPPELVGSKTTSVAQAEPDVISKAVALSKDAGLPLIVGAGIKSSEDVRVSLELGATGFAIASSIITAADPRKELLELIKGYD